MQNPTPETKRLQMVLTPSERRLIKQVGKYKSVLPYSAVIVLFALIVWYRFLPFFTQTPFFLLYNAIVYLALVAIIICGYFYQKKISALFDKLLDAIEGQRIEG